MKKNKKRDLLFRIAALFMLLPLGASVAVQWNDPDGFVWMLIYGYSLVITIPAAFGVYTGWAIPGMIGYLGGFFWLVPGFEAPYLKSELTREGGGLLIAGVWSLALAAAWYMTARPPAVPAPVPVGTLHLVPPVTQGGGGGGCGSGKCGCGK